MKLFLSLLMVKTKDTQKKKKVAFLFPHTSWLLWRISKRLKDDLLPSELQEQISFLPAVFTSLPPRLKGMYMSVKIIRQ